MHSAAHAQIDVGPDMTGYLGHLSDKSYIRFRATTLDNTNHVTATSIIDFDDLETAEAFSAELRALIGQWRAARDFGLIAQEQVPA
jgi:hypothetical protein